MLSAYFVELRPSLLTQDVLVCLRLLHRKSCVELEASEDAIVLAESQDLFLKGLRLVSGLVKLVWIIELLTQEGTVDVVLNTDAFQGFSPLVNDLIVRLQVITELNQIFPIVLPGLLVHRVQVGRAFTVVQVLGLAVESVRNGFQLPVDHSGLLLENRVHAQKVASVTRISGYLLSFIDELSQSIFAVVICDLLFTHPVDLLSVDAAAVLAQHAEPDRLLMQVLGELEPCLPWQAALEIT